ncbi:predicted protein [Plenodomus lingam JN3]|uniref:Predicted protein n=1 Tax=Leptosphaeria maculans (strain JN3 / isolate v23.1.3 / race Av1-4-5-6-7-8) TaxID=985895 RepID=E5ADB8_LEPMJ|nr:predicted protein [Plenodomus lingam JN3]CBY02470.1 predicted protein [Plenodomus lingam JN3]
MEFERTGVANRHVVVLYCMTSMALIVGLVDYDTV